jgi:hypothetical protein
VKKFSTIILLILVLFVAAIMYILNMPPRDVTLKDMLKVNPPPADADTAREEPVRHDFMLTDTMVPSATKSPESVETYTQKSIAADKAKIDYYVIVESVTNPVLAQQKAEKLKKIFRTEFIVLPPTREGIYRISNGKYSTLEEARSAMPAIRKNVRSDAWIFSMK